MPVLGDGSAREARGRGSRGAKLKRVIVLPFFLVIFGGFALSWAMYIDGSRAALRDAVSGIIRESSDRIAEEVRGRLAVAARIAGANAAFMGVYPRSDAETTQIRLAFLEELRAEPTIAILAVGTEEGEYLEAQRLSADEFRVGAAGAATGGALVFRHVDPDGGFGDRYLQADGYDPRQRPWYKAAVAAGGPTWSAPYSLYSDAEPVVAAAVPVFAGTRFAGVCSATITLRTLSSYLASMKESANGVAFVADAENRLVAVSRSAVLGTDGSRAFAATHPDPLVGAAAGAAAASLERRGASDPGRISFVSEGKRYLGRVMPFSPGPGLGWTIVLAVAESAYSEKLLSADLRNFVIMAVFLTAALFVGWLVVEYVTKPIRMMADGVDILLPGQDIPENVKALAARDNELGRLSRSFVAMKSRLDDSFGALETSLAEKDVLLKEVHHRVKNNLQIVSSILSIQSGSLDDESAKAAFDECQNRIQAMALVHEEVYRTGSYVELGMSGYLSRICETLSWGRDRGACETAVAVRVDDEAALSLDKAIPCGLVVNELVVNALKHAFPGREIGTVSVSFEREGGAWRLVVSDDGVGLDDTQSDDGIGKAGPVSGDGIGEQLVAGLVAQLNGTLRYASPASGGTEVIVEFPA